MHVQGRARLKRILKVLNSPVVFPKVTEQEVVTNGLRLTFKFSEKPTQPFLPICGEDLVSL